MAEDYIDAGQPERAVEVLEKSLPITGDSVKSGQARQLLKLANQRLGELETRYSGS